MELDAQREQEVQNKLASLVEEFNKLVEDQRYAEAERIAKQAHELAPDAAVMQNLCGKAGSFGACRSKLSIDEKKEQGFYDALTAVDTSSHPFNDRRALQFGDVKEWQAISPRAAARGWNNSANV